MAILLPLAVSGCTRQSPGDYVHREQVAALPVKHQREMDDYLRRYFGTAEEPRFREPAELDEDASDPEEVPLRDRVSRSELKLGLAVYNLRCASCHGATGDGNGPAAAYLDPRPRDYRQGTFKFTSTPRGSMPRREDLRRIILRGAKGTSMPNFRWLPEDELEAVIEHVVMLSQRGQFEQKLIQESELELDEDDGYEAKYVAEFATEVADSWTRAASEIVRPVTNEPPYDEQSILLGQKAFLSQGCAKCHGDDGRGGRRPGVSADDVPKDDWGQVAYAADLTSGMLHGGRRPLDIYRRIYSGINGTPMPGFAEAFQDSPQTIWHLTHFVISVVEGRAVSEEALP